MTIKSNTDEDTKTSGLFKTQEENLIRSSSKRLSVEVTLRVMNSVTDDLTVLSLLQK